MFSAEAPAPAAAPGPSGAAPASLPAASGAADKLAPRCWRTVYLLLDLYAHMPDAETITHRYAHRSASSIPTMYYEADDNVMFRIAGSA